MDQGRDLLVAVVVDEVVDPGVVEVDVGCFQGSESSRDTVVVIKREIPF